MDCVERAKLSGCQVFCCDCFWGGFESELVFEKLNEDWICPQCGNSEVEKDIKKEDCDGG